MAGHVAFADVFPGYMREDGGITKLSIAIGGGGYI